MPSCLGGSKGKGREWSGKIDPVWICLVMGIE